MSRREIIGRYKCADGDGNEYTVVESQEIITARHMNGESEMRGTKACSLLDGSPVNFVDDMSFKIVGNGTIIRRV